MNRNLFLISALAAGVVFCWLALGRVDPTTNTSPSPEFVGTWTDEKGAPGNYLRLQFVPRPSALPGIQYLEGRGQVQGLFGEVNTAINWNYESFEPLRLNVVLGTRTMVAPVRMLGADRMLIRWVPTADVDGWSGTKALDGPGAVILTRTKFEPEAP